MLYYKNLNRTIYDFSAFDGINDYAIVEGVFTSGSDMYLQPFSFHCSFTLETPITDFRVLFSNRYTGAGNGYLILFDNNIVYFGFWNGAWQGLKTYTINYSFAINQIGSFVITYDGLRNTNSAKLYINGVPITTSNSGSYSSSLIIQPNIAISRSDVTTNSIPRNIKAKIYNQSMVNYVKTPAEIASDHANKKQNIDLLKGDYLYNVVFNKPPQVTTFQTQETIPKTVTIFK